MGLARGKGPLTYRGTLIHIYPDLPAELSKLWSTFNTVKVRLQDSKVDYSLYYPAILAINLNIVWHTFNFPQAVEDFCRANITLV